MIHRIYSMRSNAAEQVIDARNLYELNADPRVMEFLSPQNTTLSKRPRNLAEGRGAQRALRQSARIFSRRSRKGVKSSSARSSCCRLAHAPDDTKNLEIGYRLKQRWWGKGLGTRKARLRSSSGPYRAIRRAPIFANAMLGNRASIRIMKKIGLRFEKDYTETDGCGKIVEFVMYSRDTLNRS